MTFPMPPRSGVGHEQRAVILAAFEACVIRKGLVLEVVARLSVRYVRHLDASILLFMSLRPGLMNDSNATVT